MCVQGAGLLDLLFCEFASKSIWCVFSGETADPGLFSDRRYIHKHYLYVVSYESQFSV
jgi:hypothetical protein